MEAQAPLVVLSFSCFCMLVKRQLFTDGGEDEIEKQVPQTRAARRKLLSFNVLPVFEGHLCETTRSRNTWVGSPVADEEDEDVVVVADGTASELEDGSGITTVKAFSCL